MVNSKRENLDRKQRWRHVNIFHTLKNKYHSDKVLITEWIMAGIIGAFIFVSFNYIDLKSLTIWSTNLWDVLYDGRFFDYYAFSAENIHNISNQYVGCDITAFLPWAVWNFPIWLVQRFGGLEIVKTPWMLAWSKLFLVGVLAAVLYYTYKICMMLTDNRNKSMWAVFLSASSAFVYINIFYAGQNDLLSVFFSVVAIYKLMQNKQWIFLLFSALAISVKPFFLFPLIAVILLYEKSIPKAVLKTASTLSVLLASKLLFLGAPMYKESLQNGPINNMLLNIFSSKIVVGFGSISFFAMALVVVYFFCFTRKCLDDHTRNKYCIYAVMVTYMLYFMLSFDSFYRPMLLVPFLYIMIVQNKRLFQYNILLETFMSFFLTLHMALRGSPIFRTIEINYTWVQQLFGEVKNRNEIRYPTLNFALAKIGRRLFAHINIINILWPAISGVAFICAFLLIVLNFPREKIKLPMDGEICERWILWLRMCIVLPFAALALYCFFGVH